jgi:Ni/Co efflux regulator RcnB
MRKLIAFGLMAAVALPTASYAQSNAEIRRDREEVREQRENLRDARANGDQREVREAREDVREARQELREDRRDRRNSRYVAPYRNWSYTTLAPGARLRSGYYASRYHVAEPGRQGLTRAARNQRWVRYGDDMVLVNTRNGRVLEVSRNRYEF